LREEVVQQVDKGGTAATKLHRSDPRRCDAHLHKDVRFEWLPQALSHIPDLLGSFGYEIIFPETTKDGEMQFVHRGREIAQRERDYEPSCE
jgi:hypothetical protein